LLLEGWNLHVGSVRTLAHLACDFLESRADSGTSST